MMKLWRRKALSLSRGGASTHLDGVAFIFRVHLVLGMTIFLLLPVHPTGACLERAV